jgi:hypothetical protein
LGIIRQRRIVGGIISAMVSPETSKDTVFPNKEFSVVQIAVKLQGFRSQVIILDPNSPDLAESIYHHPERAWLVLENNQPLLSIVAGKEEAGPSVNPNISDYVSILPVSSDDNRLWAQTPDNVSDLRQIGGQLSATRCLPQEKFVQAGQITIQPMGGDFIVTLKPGQSLHSSR